MNDNRLLLKEAITLISLKINGYLPLDYCCMNYVEKFKKKIDENLY